MHVSHTCMCVSGISSPTLQAMKHHEVVPSAIILEKLEAAAGYTHEASVSQNTVAYCMYLLLCNYYGKRFLMTDIIL